MLFTSKEVPVRTYFREKRFHMKQDILSAKKANSFLRMIHRAQRGHLKIYLGYAAGVGKTYQMLLEGHRLKAENIDVVIGLVETHSRIETARLVEGLETIPRRQEEYHGVTLQEMDLEAVLARKPQVALVDELAHTNLPGCKNPKRYQDVQDLLASGIHVISTLNIQHLESLYDPVEKAVQVKVRERIPDVVVAEADEIVNVDLSPEDLRKRLIEGKIYPVERVQTALSNFFLDSNLEVLRELTLRELAAQIDLRRREHIEHEEVVSPDQIMVCLSSRGPNSEMLLRYASRLAGRLNRNWYAVYVQTPSEAPSMLDAHTQGMLSDTLTLAKKLGAMVFTYRGEDIPDTIIRFSREYRVGHIVVGRPGRLPLLQRLLGKRDIVTKLVEMVRGTTVVVLDTRRDDKRLRTEGHEMHLASSTHPPFPRSLNHPLLSSLMNPDRIIIWNQRVSKEVVLRSLVELSSDGQVEDPEMLLVQLLRREQESSTFLNGEVAFPHARLDSLSVPIVTMGIAKQGLSDVLTDPPVKIIFLILSPKNEPSTLVQILSSVSRAALNRHLIEGIVASGNCQRAIGAIRQWEELYEDLSKKL